MARTKLTKESQPIANPCKAAFELSEAIYGKGEYPHPFPDHLQYSYQGWGDTPRTVVELRMCALSANLRSKPQWWVKMRDPTIKQKWRIEAIEQGAFGGEQKPEWKLTDAMVDYVLNELEGYAKLYDDATGIQVGCYERIWQSDILVSSELRDSLLFAVTKLENVPEEEKDWHPGTNKQVLDLVHPSLYPIVYGRTLAQGSLQSLKAPDVPPNVSDEFVSTHFQWLPSDFTIDGNGQASLVRGSYINNIHPKDNADLYPVIEHIVACAIPMWERVLSDLRRPLTDLRVQTSLHPDDPRTWQGYVGCIWTNEKGASSGAPYPDDDQNYGQWNQTQWKEWKESLPKRLPDALGAYEGALDAITKTVSLRESTIQVIVKLANIVLTPENPEYRGGTWHVEGMLNENIVSTFIYYYDEDNISGSCLDFRTSVIEPMYHGQDDEDCSEVLYGMSRNSPLVQHLGSQKTLQDRCIAFPNIYQHQVQPFSLTDSTKPGHRKILALFLVNPHTRIPSATTVPPQQLAWARAAVDETGNFGGKVPNELVDVIMGMTTDTLMTREQAGEVREQLMRERSVMIEEGQNYSVEFNMCEH